MLEDKLNMFSEAQAITATALSDKSIDLGLAAGAKALYQPEFFVKTGNAAINPGTALEIQIVCADDAALSTNLTVLASSGAIAAVSLTASKVLYKGKLPEIIPRRYLGMKYVVTGANASTGAITAGLTAGNPVE